MKKTENFISSGSEAKKEDSKANNQLEDTNLNISFDSSYIQGILSCSNSGSSGKSSDNDVWLEYTIKLKIQINSKTKEKLIDVRDYITLLELKTIIQDKFKIPIRNQVIMDSRTGRNINLDERKLKNFNINRNNEIRLTVIVHNPTMQVTLFLSAPTSNLVEQLNSANEYEYECPSIALDLEIGMTVNELRNLLSEKFELDRESMGLSLIEENKNNGKYLSDEYIISSTDGNGIYLSSKDEKSLIYIFVVITNKDKDVFEEEQKQSSPEIDILEVVELDLIGEITFFEILQRFSKKYDLTFSSCDVRVGGKEVDLSNVIKKTGLIFSGSSITFNLQNLLEIKKHKSQRLLSLTRKKSNSEESKSQDDRCRVSSISKMMMTNNLKNASTYQAFDFQEDSEKQFSRDILHLNVIFKYNNTSIIIKINKNSSFFNLKLLIETQFLNLDLKQTLFIYGGDLLLEERLDKMTLRELNFINFSDILVIEIKDKDKGKNIKEASYDVTSILAKVFSMYSALLNNLEADITDVNNRPNLIRKIATETEEIRKYINNSKSNSVKIAGFQEVLFWYSQYAFVSLLNFLEVVNYKKGVASWKKMLKFFYSWVERKKVFDQREKKELEDNVVSSNESEEINNLKRRSSDDCEQQQLVSEYLDNKETYYERYFNVKTFSIDTLYENNYEIIYKYERFVANEFLNRNKQRVHGDEIYLYPESNKVLQIPYFCLMIRDVVLQKKTENVLKVSLERIPFPANRNSLIWVDDNPTNNESLLTRLIDQNLSITLCLQTEDTLIALKYIKWIVYVRKIKLSLISDMERIKNEKSIPDAGVRLLKIIDLEQQLQFEKFIFTSNEQKAREFFKLHKIAPSSIGTKADDIYNFIEKNFENVKVERKKKPTQLVKISKTETLNIPTNDAKKKDCKVF